MNGFVFLPLATGPIFWFFGQDFIAGMREETWGFIVAGESSIDESVAIRIFDGLAKDRPHTAIGVGFQDMRTINRGSTAVLGAVKTDCEFAAYNSGEN